MIDSIKKFFALLFSADDGIIAHAYVSNSVYCGFILGMWGWACRSTPPGVLADIPSGVQAALYAFSGVAGVQVVGSALVKGKELLGKRTSKTPADDDSGNARPE